MALSPYKTMWLVALFDLPTDTKKARKAYSKFRKKLLDCGFSMMQYSVYIRYCSGEDKAKVQRKRIRTFLPDDGEIRIITLTDIQYAKMQIFHGKRRKPTENAPQQIEIF